MILWGFKTRLFFWENLDNSYDRKDLVHEAAERVPVSPL